jgi:hypothetical protein
LASVIATASSKAPTRATSAGGLLLSSATPPPPTPPAPSSSADVTLDARATNFFMVRNSALLILLT